MLARSEITTIGVLLVWAESCALCLDTASDAPNVASWSKGSTRLISRTTLSPIASGKPPYRAVSHGHSARRAVLQIPDLLPALLEHGRLPRFLGCRALHRTSGRLVSEASPSS